MNSFGATGYATQWIRSSKNRKLKATTMDYNGQQKNFLYIKYRQLFVVAIFFIIYHFYICWTHFDSATQIIIHDSTMFRFFYVKQKISL